MKHWFSHHRLKKQLKASRWTLDPAYKARTKEALFQKALADHERFHVSVLATNWKTMKRYSFAYFSFLILIGLGFYNFFPNGSLSAQQLVANASSNYETSTGMIYYEKRETTDYPIFPGDVLDVHTEEVWNNDTGDVLQLLSRSGEETIGSMIKVNEVGVPIDYESVALVQTSDEGKNMADAIKRGAIYCASIEVKGNTRREALLQVAKENSAYWFISASTGDKDQGNGYGFIETSSASNVKDLLSTILDEMNQNNDLSESNNYSLEERNEDGIQKYVLTQTWIDSIGQTQQFDYIFSAQNFTLESQEYSIDEVLYSKTLYLAHATYAASERDSIFDAASNGLTESPNFTSFIPTYIQESGCYDNHKKLSEEETVAFLATLPEEATNGYEGTVFSIQNNTPYPDAENSILISDESENTEPTQADEANTKEGFTWPSSSHKISQAFLAGHTGIDITKDDESDPLPEIYAAAGGVVISTETAWNEGYGNAVQIDHGNGYITHYTHLTEFVVEVGDTVTQGQYLGLMGNTGRVYGVTGINMHFELSYNGVKVNPADYISF